MIQGGDFTHGTGVGGESIYGGKFPDEKFLVRAETSCVQALMWHGLGSNTSIVSGCTRDRHALPNGSVDDQFVRESVDGSPSPCNDRPSNELHFEH